MDFRDRGPYRIVFVELNSAPSTPILSTQSRVRISNSRGLNRIDCSLGERREGIPDQSYVRLWECQLRRLPSLR